MTTLISVIIPVYRDWQRLALCLAALERQSLPQSQFEVIVANNEPDGDCPLDRRAANVRVVHEPTPGSYAARNAAVAASAGRYLAFTDSDCLPEPDWLRNGLAALTANPAARIAGSIAIFREPAGGHHAHIYDLHVAFPQKEFAAAGTCVTANLLVARAVFDSVGPFDQWFSGADLAWNRRAQAAGVPILYAEEVRVAHPARRSVRDIFRKKRRAAGSIRDDISLGTVVVEAIKPPVRRLVMLRRKGVRWKHALPIFMILWVGRILRAQEVGFVRLGLKQPNRS
ncbi:MAG TPA: glycosyltransferase [Allosphingosinicella sp.]|nr:glycosyltransferase [Allosphingosinicella sp.]